MENNPDNNALGNTSNQSTSNAKFDLLELCKEIIKTNNKQWVQLSKGKRGLMGYFIGQVMRQCLKQPSVGPYDVVKVLDYLIETKFLLEDP